MAQADIPRQVRRFIAKYIDSVAALEALLLLRGAPHEMWDVSRVAGRLYLLGLWRIAEETEPLVYLARLVTFGLIIVAIVQKNRRPR